MKIESVGVTVNPHSFGRVEVVSKDWLILPPGSVPGDAQSSLVQTLASLPQLDEKRGDNFVEANPNGEGVQSNYPIPASLAFIFPPGTTPWSPLPAIGPTPIVTPLASLVDANANVEIYSYETVFANSLSNLFSSYAMPILSNHGTIWGQNSGGVTLVAGGNWEAVVNYGHMVAISQFYDATGFMSGSWGILQNYGDIFAISYGGLAQGYISWSPGSWSRTRETLNEGSIQAWSATGVAHAVSLQNAGTFLNSGTLHAAGALQAVGIIFSTHDGRLVNSGTILAVSPASGISIAVVHDWAGDLAIENTGWIEGEIALYANLAYTYRNIINNSGTIIGDIIVQNSIEEIVNAGYMEGILDLGDHGDVYDGRMGVLVGEVRLGDGDDIAYGGAATDFILGGRGNDRIESGGGDDVIDGGFGNDILDGGNGFDIITFLDAQIGIRVDLNIATPQDTIGYGLDTITNIEGVIGSDFSDTIIGNAESNMIAGGRGNDTLTLGAGADTVVFGLDGGQDTITDFNPAVDRVLLVGWTGAQLEAAIASATAVAGGTQMTFAAGQTLTFLGVAPSQLTPASFMLPATEIIGSPGPDVLVGTSGDDLMFGLAGNDTLLGYAGNDSMFGDSGNDILVGYSGDDELDGGLGNDYLYGDEGNDLLRGGPGDDILVAGIGDDILEAGDGFDYLYAGDGNDTMSAVSGINVFIGEGGNDTMTGGTGRDYMYGGDGDDIMFGGDGIDILIGEDGRDTMDGGAGQDYLYAGAGDDILIGGDGVDFMLGEAGNDTLNGGRDVNYLYGGAGADIFVQDFAQGAGVDVISDFEYGVDRIRLVGGTMTNFAAVQANMTYNTINGFTVIQTSATTAIWLAGDVRSTITAASFEFVASAELQGNKTAVFDLPNTDPDLFRLTNDVDPSFDFGQLGPDRLVAYRRFEHDADMRDWPQIAMLAAERRGIDGAAPWVDTASVFDSDADWLAQTLSVDADFLWF